MKEFNLTKSYNLQLTKNELLHTYFSTVFSVEVEQLQFTKL